MCDKDSMFYLNVWFESEAILQIQGGMSVTGWL